MRKHLPLALLLLVAPPAVHGQSAGPPAAGTPAAETPVFVEAVDVNVINVEVFVTDRDAQPVVGLTAEDFEIYEDGQPVEISNFFTGARRDRVAEELDRDLAELKGEAIEGSVMEPLPENQQLNLVVYVDHFNLRHNDRRRVLDDLEGILEDRMFQGDRVMLVSYEQQLEIVEPFTRDRQRIRDGLRGMHAVTAHRQIADAERRRTLRLMTAVARDSGENVDGQLESSYNLLRSYVQSERNNLRRTAKAIQQLARSLAGLPGRKAVLYVSSGLSQRPGEELYQHLLDLFGDSVSEDGTPGLMIDPSMESLREDESQLFTRIARQANAHQVTFYTLDARGGLAGSSMSAEFADISVGSVGHVGIDQMRAHNLQEPLVSMAAATGGRAILGTDNFDDAFATMTRDFDTFYSLGYRPPRAPDGEYHNIEVKVKRPGMRVRHRAGYESKPEVERVADRTLSSLLLGLEKNPLAIHVEFGEPEKAGRGKLVLPILVRVPIQEVTLLFQEASAEGRLQFFMVVQDANGISDLHQQPYPVSIPSYELEAARGREIGYGVKLKIRKGTPKIAVGVWDELSGVESFVQQRVLVEDSPEG